MLAYRRTSWKEGVGSEESRQGGRSQGGSNFRKAKITGPGAGGLNEPKRRRSITRDAAHSLTGEGRAAPVEICPQWHVGKR